LKRRFEELPRGCQLGRTRLEKFETQARSEAEKTAGAGILEKAKMWSLGQVFCLVSGLWNLGSEAKPRWWK
jgi:hypothetical protein